MIKAPFPTKADIIRFIAAERDAGREVGKREIARAFTLPQGGRIWLKQLLREIEAETDRPRKGREPGSGVPSVMLIDITGRDRDGELIATPTEWAEADGPVPRITVTVPRKALPGTPIPGVGERVLAKMHARGDNAWEARALKIIARERPTVMGVFRAYPDGGGRVESVERKARSKEILIQYGDEGEAKDGDLVSVTLAKVGARGGLGVQRGRIKERLGSVKSERAVSLIAIHAHGIPQDFSAAAIAQAATVKPATAKGREDWRALPLVTIDPADAKDHDDAVHAAPDDDAGNPGGHVLTVAIADVAAYVKPGSALDREALERGNSVYFPDRVVPMLPERISNDLCSLRDHEDRPALAVRITLAADGRKLRHSFHRVLMRSVAKLAYEQAQSAIDGQPDDVTRPLIAPVLKPLWAAYGALKTAREGRQPLELDLPERKLVLDTEGRVLRVMIPGRLEAHRLIEECMILANVCAAESLERALSGLMYRVHDEPSIEKMRGLGDVLASIGQKLPKAGALQPALFNRILGTVKGTEHETFINEVVLRSQAQALYSPENLGHFGLNLRKYAHYTSPIRRYADLIVHRALITHLRLGDDGLPSDTSRKELVRIGEMISASERRAMAAERETIDRLVAYFLADQIGATFEGRIAGVTRSGLFVKLNETGADGFVPAATLGADYYAYDEATHSLTGSHSGESFRLGDTVSAKLVEVAPVAGALRFEIVSDGRKAGPLRSGPRGFMSKGRGGSPGKGRFSGARAGRRR
ncbi:MAG: ribonuclease R [Hyphomicrobiales bacterium]|nr:ribonuclease R [Hyphomicrobiales bacterium]